MISERALIARYFHRFAFGPKPGQFKTSLAQGSVATLKNLLNPAPNNSVSYPVFETLGPIPAPGILRSEWSLKMRSQREQLYMWWLDLMATTDNPFQERMVWFWHGHWATSIDKVEYANAMLVQNKIFRDFATGNFADMAQRMIMDGALQYWLDNNSNTIKAPNENLARELMELFTLGVNKYTETDIKQVAKALTGYTLDRESGQVTFQPAKHDTSIQNILGTNVNYDGKSLVTMLVGRNDCTDFISKRLWFRFVNDLTDIQGNDIQNSFSGRDIFNTFKTLASHSALKSEDNSMVKPPLEWFIGACRSLNVLPSQLAKPTVTLNYLDKLAQKPFAPPNVGGWPSGEIWLTAANSQYRIEMAQLLVKAGDINAIANTAITNRVSAVADLLGVGEWSSRTKSALIASQSLPAQLVTTALCAPEYLVNI